MSAHIPLRQADRQTDKKDFIYTFKIQLQMTILDIPHTGAGDAYFAH